MPKAELIQLFPDPKAVAAQSAEATLAEQIKRLQRRPRAAATEQAYTSDWKHFALWCAENDHPALPSTPGAVIAYLVAHREAFKPATLERRLGTVQLMHKAQGIADAQNPAKDTGVRLILQGIRREVGTAQKQMEPILPSDLRRMVAKLDLSTRRGLRDRLILTLGFATALRRSNLAALRVEDIEEGLIEERLPDGTQIVRETLIVTVRRSKTDQEGKGFRIGVKAALEDTDICAVRAYRDWINALKIRTGPVMLRLDGGGAVQYGVPLRGQGVAYIIKRNVESIGMDPKQFGGHSLRAGFATAAAAAGIAWNDIARTTGHKNLTILQRYVRHRQIWDAHAGSKIIR